MKILKKNITDLVEAPYNPRKKLMPSDVEYEKIKKSILEFGYVDPIIWNEQTGNVVGGHQRLQVLKDLGHTDIECVVVNIDDKKEKALNLALNKITGEWDMPLLKDLLSELNDNVFDVSLTGFDAEEIDKMFAELAPLDLDDDANDNQGNGQTCHCPKCGFIFKVD